MEQHQTKVYQVVDVPGKGKVMIASRDLLPGQVIVHKEKPIMYISKEYLKQFSTAGEIKMLVAGFNMYYRHLSAEDKARFDVLFGPTTGIHAGTYRTMAESDIICRQKPDGSELSFSPEEAELFVRVANTIALNAFELARGGHVIMDEITRMSHSCLPNCSVELDPTWGTCRAILPVKKGEELTLEYCGDHRLKPTHFRRHRYLERKDFTCHCPRCDAEADDTREFNCFDPKCLGSCFACQPINKEPFINDFNFKYTGVEYVEPHLLPCTVCHRAPPLKYQEDMFKLEQELSAIAEALKSENHSQPKRQSSEGSPRILKKIEAMRLPLNHSLAMGVLQTVYELHINCVVAFGPRATPAAERALQDYLNIHERLIRCPTDIVCERYRDMCQCQQAVPNLMTLTFAKKCGERALRLHLIMRGRDSNKRQEFDDLLVAVLKQMPPQPATTDCMFCRESPANAAFSLSRCGRCKQVAYCSAGCQKAHWPVHKKGCNKVG